MTTTMVQFLECCFLVDFRFGHHPHVSGVAMSNTDTITFRFYLDPKSLRAIIGTLFLKGNIDEFLMNRETASPLDFKRTTISDGISVQSS